MLEGFKINCFPLNRAIRISIALPKEYNNTSRYYPVIYFLDGQNLYKDADSYRNHSLGLESIIEQLSLEGKDAIYVGIAAANDPSRRNTEYQDTTLAKFIISSLHPYLVSRYRMNSYIYSFGCSSACYTALLLLKEEIFKGAILLSPLGDLEKMVQLELHPNSLIYIYAGENEMEGNCAKLAHMLKEKHMEACLELDENQEHNEKGWQHKVLDALNYLVL